MPYHHATGIAQGGAEDRDRDGYLLPVPQGPARADSSLVAHAAARRQDHLLGLPQPAWQRDRSAVEEKFDQRHLLQVSCREAWPVPIRARAGAGKLPELPRSARQQQRIHAESVATAIVRRMPRLRSRSPDQRADGRRDIRALVPELPCRNSRKQQSFGSAAPTIGALKVEL